MQSYQLLNCDDHASYLMKHKKDPALYRPDITHQVTTCYCTIHTPFLSLPLSRSFRESLSGLIAEASSSSVAVVQSQSIRASYVDCRLTIWQLQEYHRPLHLAANALQRGGAFCCNVVLAATTTKLQALQLLCCIHCIASCVPVHTGCTNLPLACGCSPNFETTSWLAWCLLCFTAGVAHHPR